MDVDDPQREMRDEVVRQNLHIARHDHEVDAMALQEVDDLRLLLRLLPLLHRAAEIRDVEPVRDIFEIRVVADDQRNIAVQIALVGVHEQVVQAVRGLGGHNRDIRLRFLIEHRIFEPEFRRKPGELLFEPAAGDFGPEFERDTHEIAFRPDVRILAALQNIESAAVKET